MKKLLILFCCLLPMVLQAQIITTVAGIGIGPSSGEGGPAVSARTPLPFSGAFDSYGNYYYTESAGTPRVRKINTAGIITTVAGNGISGYGGDGGPATMAKITNAMITVDSVGNIFIADYNNNRLRKVDVTTGLINTICGNGTSTSTGDGGPATSATLKPLDVCVDNWGNIFISDDIGQCTRKINTSGIITTIAGTSAQGMCFDKHGSLYLGGGVRVFKVDTATGHIDTIAGTGVATYSGDNIPATTANLKVFDIAIDGNGNIFVADWSNARIRKIDTFGYIHTVAGNGVAGFSGDGGLATAAQIYQPEGVALDICGNLYIADKANHRIRKVTTDSPIISTPTIALSGGISFPLGSTVPVTAVVSGAGSSYIIYWMNHGITFTSTTIPSVTYTKGPGIDTITAKVVSTAAYGCFDSTISSGHIVSVSTLGITNATTQLSIYPNPVTHMLHIDNLQTNAGYRILSIVGAAVQQGQLRAGNNELDIRTLPPGVYLLEVTDDSERTMMRVVKQ